MKKLSC